MHTLWSSFEGNSFNTAGVSSIVIPMPVQRIVQLQYSAVEELDTTWQKISHTESGKSETARFH